jgi:general secretion pathway protein F
MPAFRYEAVDAAGRPRRGLLDATSARAARDALRGEGLFPTAVDAMSGSAGARTDATRLAAGTLALTTRQLATLVTSGMPLDQALAAVAEQADHPGAVRVLTAIREQVAAGEPLSSALSRFPRTFSQLYRGLAAVGAESGQLGQVLSRLADYLEARQALRQKFVAALIYPALVTLIALAVIATLLLYVVPQIVAVYQQSRQTLPWLTRALIASSDFARATAWYWLGVAVAIALAWTFSLRSGGRSGFSRRR